MLDPSIRKFAEAAGKCGASVVIPTANDLIERDRLAFRLTVAIAAACMAEYDKLQEREPAA